MLQPRITVVPLREISNKLPSDCWIVSRLGESTDLDEESAVYVRGDLRLSALDLDRPLAADGELRALLKDASYSSNTVFLILIEGSLYVEQSITNENTDGATNLIVSGDLLGDHIVIGGQYVHVGRMLTARNLLWGDYNHGSLRVTGSTRARVAVFSDEYDVALSGGETFTQLLDEVREVPSLIEFSNERVHAVFDASVLNDALEGDSALSQMIDREAVVTALRMGKSVVRTDEAIAAFMPMPSDVLTDDELSVANVLACVNSGLIEGDAPYASGWFAQTDFSIYKRGVNDDGKPHDDYLFITAWKSIDLYIGVAQQAVPEKQGFMAMMKSVLSNRPEPTKPVLAIQCRNYTDGEPGDWGDLDDLDEATRKTATQAWRGTLDYVRKAIGQIRAGYPIAQRVRSEITNARIAALIALPIFTEKHNDWWGDDNGFWKDEIWVAARQRCEHDSKSYLRAIKLAWENGDEAPGDDDDGDATASFLLEETTDENAQWTIEIDQRQSSAFATLPRAAADHQLRLLRYFDGVERTLMAAAKSEADERAERQRIIDSVVLLKPPPYGPLVLDRAIFPRELMTLSESWQSQGREHCASIRAIHAEYEAHPENSPDDEDDDFVWPVDQRAETWPTVMQLARVVSTHADADLSKRFRNLFSFAASGMHKGAANHGQFIGPLFLLDDGRVVTRAGPAYDTDAYWVLLDGLTHTRLPELSGLGRSPNRKCFASCENGVLITRDGFQGAEIVRFTLPTGVEGLPESLNRTASSKGRRCDQLIPFNNGLRVLVLNDTGVYSVDQTGVQRLHPQIFDEDGPYTWPKNNHDDDLSLSMEHMALSADERFIMVGDQDSQHELLRADGTLVRQLDPVASYPHHALFSFDGTQVLANSCHLYAGYTSITRVDSEDEPRDFNDSWRVYTSIAAPSFVILGNAEGYIHAVDYDGNIVWRHHIGSSMSGVDISADGNTIIAASYGGYLARLEKLSGQPDPFAIGTSPFTETSRWIFWKDEPAPIYW